VFLWWSTMRFVCNAICVVYYMLFSFLPFFSFWRLYLEADESAVIARPLISKGNCAIPAAVPHFLTHIHPVQQQPKKYNNTEILIGSNNVYIQHTRVLYTLYAKTLCCVYLFTRLPTSCQWGKRKKRDIKE
jgi:hypothetical protein